jgi:F0F1-type ATP synthase membrane subunit b/b'
VLAEQQANQKVAKAALVVKKVQEIALAFETQAKEEYEQIILDAKQERKEILKSAKDEIAQLFAAAEKDLRDYREKRYQEIEKNLVKLVMAITGKVIGDVLDEKQHEQLIDKAIEEIKLQQQRTN